MPIPARSIRPHRGALCAVALAVLAATPALAGSPADLLLPPLGEPAPVAPAWAELGSATAPAPAPAPRPGAAPLAAQQVSAAANWSFESNVVNRKLGLAVQPVGDLNGDGFSDFAALGDLNSFNTALYVFLGSATGPALAAGYPVTNLPAAAIIAPAGDVNGDGRDDLTMFWTGSGNVRLYFGTATGVDLVNYNQLTNHFTGFNPGLTAAPAGDVNGDGYADLIFGQPEFDYAFPCAAATFAGRAEVLYGSASGISASNQWYLTGCYATGSNARVGTSVAGAGDVNGDGYDDIVIGAPGASLTAGEGAVYIQYGSATGLPTVNGIAGMGFINYGTKLFGQHTNGGFGTVVAPAGDVNGDGYADIAVGAPGDDTYGTDAGMAFVFRGTAAGTDTAVANLLWFESSGVPGAKMGVTVAPAGDVDGDSRPDLLVGVTGGRYLARGTSGGLYIDQYFAYPPATAPLVTAGDVNGDGMSDLLAGNPGWTSGESGEGQVLVHYGGGRAPASAPQWSFTQIAIDNPNLGWSVASAGDVNGDGYEDVLVGEPTWYNFLVGGSVNNGIVQLFYGHATGLSAAPDWYAYGANNEQLGVAVAGADLNGDGYSDVIVGAHFAAGSTGQARIWYGSPTGLSNSGPSLTLTGPDPGGYFGSAVGAAGDVNGDGYPDLVVGAFNAENPAAPLADEGRAYVYLGGAGGLSASPVSSLSGGQVGAHLGQSVAGAGDVNGDGFADVIVGAPDYDVINPGGVTYVDGGRAIVAYGSPAGLAGTFAMKGSWDGGRFGASVAGAGDVNGDGYSDVVVGAPSATGSISGEGAAQAFTGSAIGFMTPAWTQYGGEAFGGFGSAVSSAGDVDGDGLSDVLVGAVFQNMGGPNDQGRAYVYRGPLPGGAAAFWYASGGSTTANLGHALASAGDVNGDGWNDLVFGLPGYNGSGFRQGLARVYYGADGGGRFQVAFPYHFSAPTHIVQPGGLTDPGGVYLGSTARSARGRGKVRLQWTVDPVVGLPAAGASGFTSWIATGNPGANGSTGGAIFPVSPLVAGVPYAWKVRSLARSVYFPTGPWRTAARSGRREADFRIPGSYLDVADGTAGRELLLADVRPNPMVSTTSVVFSLSRPGDVSLAVHDVQGRRVRTLAHGGMSAGEHRVAWDGRGEDGVAASAGVYLVRLEAEGRVLSRKVVRVR